MECRDMDQGKCLLSFSKYSLNPDNITQNHTREKVSFSGRTNVKTKTKFCYNFRCAQVTSMSGGGVTMSQSGVVYSLHGWLQLREAARPTWAQCVVLLHQDWWHSSSRTRLAPHQVIKYVKTFISSWGQCNISIYIWGHFQACCLLCIRKRFANIRPASLSSACSAGLQSAFTLHCLTRTRPEIDRGWKVWIFCNLGQCFILITSF